MFGFPRLKETVDTFPGGQRLIDRVLADLDAFTGPGAEQEDDITMVTIERSAGRPEPWPRRPGTSSPSSSCRVSTGGEREAMTRVTQAVESLGLEPARLERLGTAVAEATMNAMEHGNEFRADRPVLIRVLHSGDRLLVQVSDSGERGELPAREAPDLEAKLEGRQTPRGWGLLLIEKMVDEAKVTSEATGHTLELTLYLEGDADGES